MQAPASSPSLPLAALLAIAVAPARAQNDPPPPTKTPSSVFDLAERKAAHWAWQPLADPVPPPVRDAAWVRDPLDAFVLARLEQHDLRPAPPADPATLLRRVHFDLCGLPPPPELASQFEAAPSDAAYDRIVDDLLASPHHAEHQARHWLDLVRFAESLGHEYDFAVPNAWRYRDYVVRALHEDLPFDQFGKEHIAGDLLPAPRRNPSTGDNESVQATGFFWFAEQTHAPVDVVQHQADRIDNQIDVMTKAFCGLTVACARCHDHKFDAIKSADYYSLYGFLKSSRYAQRPVQTVSAQAPGFRAALAAQRDYAAAFAQAAGSKLAPADGSDARIATRLDDVVIADAGEVRGWQTIGDAFGDAPWDEPFCSDEQAAAPGLTRLPGPFWSSAIAGRRREGVLQTGTFVLDRPYVHVLVAGHGGRAVLVLEGFHLVRDPIYGDLHQKVDGGNARWVTFDVHRWQGRSAFVEFVDQQALGLADPEENTYPADAWIAARTVLGSQVGAPPPLPGANAAATATPWPTPPPAVLIAQAALREACAALPDFPTVPAMVDGTGQDEQVFVRGSHKQRGAAAPRRFLEALCGTAPMQVPGGSGRLQLADAMFGPDNPLPARVLVNRAFHHLFGRGLAKSVDNLGELGDRPTHPELLDRLARDVIKSGWSQKALLRRIVRSATYRMSSRSDLPEVAKVDPANLLLHRQNVRRLPAEAVRDSLLCVADRLDPGLYGQSVPVPLSSDHEARGKPKQSGPVDGRGRRSIYLAVNRNFLPPMLLCFDLPTPFATVGARPVSNVPAQALTLLNDPFVHGMCRLWAEHELAGEELPDPLRIERFYRRAFGRAPHPDEVARCREFVAEAAAARTTDDGGTPTDEVAPWADLAHALANCKEFTFLR